MMKLGVIGCGLIGQKRARSVVETGGHSILAACDIEKGRADALASSISGCRSYSDPAEVLARKDIDAVFVSTTHDRLAHISLAAVQAGKHVLVEKPCGIRSADMKKIAGVAKKKKKIVKAGFNHRFHPSFRKAKDLVDAGRTGPLLFIRARYGHGGRVGYEKEWRANKKVSGGGEIVDQGTHLIDLSRMFLGDFSRVTGYTPTYFWKMRVEDNAFMLLRTKSGTAAWLHASWTEWKNTFSFEIYGRDAKIQIDGLGGSYGTERLTFYKMKPEMGPPDTETWEFSGPDESWRLEFENFVDAAAGRAKANGDITDAVAAFVVVEKIYAENKR